MDNLESVKYILEHADQLDAALAQGGEMLGSRSDSGFHRQSSSV